MSFYQEYLKKQRNKESGVEKPITQEEGQIEESDIEEPITEEGQIEESDSEKPIGQEKDEVEESDTIIPKTDDVPPAMPVQLNSDNTQGKFSEIQKAEEKERQDFLKRVKGENVLPPVIDKEPVIEDTKINVPRKPPKIEKLLIRLTIILALIAVIAIIGLLWYQSSLREMEKEVVIEEIFVSEAIAPQSLLNYDLFEYPKITRANEFIPHIFQYMNMETEEEALIKIMFQDQRIPRQPEFINARLFLNTFSIIMPLAFEEITDQENFNLFIHSKESGNEIGFAIIVNNVDKLIEIMREWEDNAVRDLSQFLSLIKKENQTNNPVFTSFTYHQNIIRCLEFQDGSDVCYTTVREELSDIFIFTTSSDTIRTVIDSL